MTILDWILVATLVVVLPAEALWKSVVRRGRPKDPLARRLARSLRVILVLLAFLFMIWGFESRSYQLLGLDLPVSTAGLIGLAAACVILAGLAAAVMMRKGSPSQSDAAAAADVMPTGRRETILFIVFGLAAGIGWELLYRGFLLWALTPWITGVGAVVVAAVAYALGHGSRGTGSLVGATIASFLFTIGYAVTGSLWWLMLLHAGLPMIGLLASRRVSRAART
jgi:membrane protease YdiL (CAAX protease family)